MERRDVISIMTQALDPEMPILNRKLPRAKFNTGGRSTGLTQAVWFEFLFELNEKNHLLGNTNKVLPDRVILANWVKEFEDLGTHPITGNKIGGGISSGKISIGMYRNRCRLGRLYDHQPKPILMPFKYCAQGYPCREKTKSVVALTVEECRNLCLEYKIADPRYFNPQEIANIKSHAEKKSERSAWGVPSKSQWEELDDSVAGGIFGRYSIYNQPYDESWSPLTW